MTTPHEQHPVLPVPEEALPPGLVPPQPVTSPSVAAQDPAVLAQQLAALQQQLAALQQQAAVPQQPVPPAAPPPPPRYTPATYTGAPYAQSAAPPAAARPMAHGVLPYAAAGPSKGSGLAIVAFVLAVLALLLCWVPIINNLAAVIGLLGLAFGVPALLSARKGRRSGKGLATASVVLSVLAVAGVLATQVFYGKVIDGVAASVDDAFSDAEDSAAGLGADQSPEELAAAQAAATLAVGESATVGDYTVTITGINADANAVVAGVNQFNDPPVNGFVLIDATVTYNGATESTPWIDLSAAVLGSDGRQYDDGATSVVTPREDAENVTLRAGGSSEIDFVMDIPAAALAGGKIMVESSLTFDETAVYWAVP